MTLRVWVVAPEISPIHDWVGEARASSAEEATAVVCAPDEVEVQRGLHPETPIVACMPMSRDEYLVAEGALERVHVRADAYATTSRGLHEAIEWVATEDRSMRNLRPLRLTWLGALGQREPPRAGPIGRTYPLEQRVLVGRDNQCTIMLRTGPHSDQNTVARSHALLERHGSLARVLDLRSTTGTWVDGEPARDQLIAPGAEIAFACTLRFRLDGAAD